MHGLADFILIAEGLAQVLRLGLSNISDLYFLGRGSYSRSKHKMILGIYIPLIPYASCSMTWNGKQGFQTPIQNDSFIVEGVGALGTAHTERGLNYVEVELSGHM